MFVDVFTTQESSTYTTSIEMWLEGERRLVQAIWSRVKPEGSIAVTVNRRPTFTITPDYNSTPESIETILLTECAVRYHKIDRRLAEAVTERSALHRAGNARSNRSRYLRKIIENHYALNTWEVARAGDRRYFRYALDEMPKPRTYQVEDRDGTLRYHQLLTLDTLLKITRNTIGNELPGNTFSATLGEALENGWLSTDGGTMSYSISIHPRHQDAYMNDQVNAIGKRKKWWTIVEEINFGDYE
ncbi:hypothetical protein [Vreelandella alkaliphila]|uniref:Uncharacterized protein n=1 Tax=Vreelandella alkaliphila TaxID=272774 RepID=A0A7C9NX40_9GAMM|nr:hypothetical protein [Halomonas alkaliphila]NDL70491.1 hypothetical protein [Halomonas alkaliphila]